MTGHAEKPEQSKFFRDLVVPILVVLASGCLGFAVQSVRSDSVQATQLEEMKQDIQKVRALPSPDQIVTKDQLTEIVRRLDERTQQISRDVEYLRDREEKRAK